MFHRFDRRGKAWQLRFVFVEDTRTLVGESDGVSIIEDRDDDLLETGVDEVFRHLSNNRIRNAAARKLRLLVDSRSKIFDVLRRFSRRDFGDTRRASEVVVQGDSRGSRHV